MFFSNIAEYTNKKLSILYYSFLSVYFMMILVAPIGVVTTKYGMFTTETGTKTTLTGMGICVLIAVAVIALSKFKQQINKFPENTVNQRRIKFTCEMFYGLAIPVFVVAIMIAMKVDFDRAYETIKECIIFYIAGVVVDNMFVKYLASERSMRFESQNLAEKQKRLKFFE